MCSFPWAIVHASLQHFGLGLTDMHTEQGITHLLILLKHGYQTDDLTGQLIQGLTENMRLELGFSGRIFTLPYQSWIKMVWQFQQTHSICLNMDILDLTLARVNDILIMPAFHAARFWGRSCTTQSMPTPLTMHLIGDLCNRSSNYLNPEMWAGRPNTTFMSGYTWPNQTRPTKQDWICWQITICSSFHFNFLHCLVSPLEQWLLPPLHDKQRWRWLISPSANCLYQWLGKKQHLYFTSYHSYSCFHKPLDPDPSSG